MQPREMCDSIPRFTGEESKDHKVSDLLKVTTFDSSRARFKM